MVGFWRLLSGVRAKATEKEADEMSISSYETGHENLNEDQKEEGPPPPHDDHDASDSASSASTQTPVAPVRRKSVRVSLQPTFSPTPPAFDDDDEDGTHAPWGERDGSSTATAGWGRKRSAVGDNGGDGEGMWEDSSEEDEEYRRARRLLARVGKKKSRK